MAAALYPKPPARRPDQFSRLLTKKLTPIAGWRSETGRRAGRHDLAHLLAQVAKPVRQAAIEETGVAGAPYPSLVAHGDLDLPANDDRPLLGRMAQHRLTGVGAGLIVLVQDVKRAAREIAPQLTVGDLAAGDLGQILGREEHLGPFPRLHAEEVGKGNR